MRRCSVCTDLKVHKQYLVGQTVVRLSCTYFKPLQRTRCFFQKCQSSAIATDEGVHDHIETLYPPLQNQFFLSICQYSNRQNSTCAHNITVSVNIIHLSNTTLQERNVVVTRGLLFYLHE